MDYKVCKLEKPICGILYPPGDKSVTHRSLIIGSLAEDRTVVEGVLDCNDTKTTINILRQFGVNIEFLTENTCIITGIGVKGFSDKKLDLNCDSSRMTLRLMTGLLVGAGFEGQIYGNNILNSLSMKNLIEPLRLMGADIEGISEEMYPPLTIRPSKLVGINYESPIVSEQVKSAVLLASIMADGITSYKEEYISKDHTERMLAYLGAEIRHVDDFIQVFDWSIVGKKIVVPGDISSASYMIGLAVLVPNSEFVVKNVGLNPTRLGFINVLSKMGAKISMVYNEYKNEPMGDLYVEGGISNGVEISARDIPSLIDELPLICSLATMIPGKTIVNGIRCLGNKEGLRLKSTVKNLRNMGANITELEDKLIIDGSYSLHGAVVDSYNDHRIAMTMTVMGLLVDGETTIKNIECVDVSYPQFFHEINRIIKS